MRNGQYNRSRLYSTVKHNKKPLFLFFLSASACLSWPFRGQNTVNLAIAYKHTHARTKTHNNDRNKRRSSRKLKLRAVTYANCTSENCTNTTAPQVKGLPSLPNMLTLESQKIKTFTHHIKQNQYTLRITERDARASERDGTSTVKKEVQRSRTTAVVLN